MSDAVELVLTTAVLGLTTAIATKLVDIPPALVHAPHFAVVFLIVAIAAFAVYPAVGLALFLLTAVLFFKRNVARTAPILNTKRTYGIDSIRNHKIEKAYPYESVSSGPRMYNEFEETDSKNPMIGPLKEGFEPAPYGDESGAPVEGQYPKEVPRASASPERKDVYYYRPDDAMGSNKFVRGDGPYMDTKLDALTY